MQDQLTAELADRYRLERELGRGGMAVVFLARDLKHSRPVAVKVLHPELGGTDLADRFFREIEIAARLAHPNILPLHDSGQAAGHLFYVTPYVDGESLRAWLERERRLPADVAIRLAGEVAAALDYAHRHGVIHRDIKPANILIADGHAIVADFGIATALAAADGERLTRSGMALGTPGYMSPEQALGGTVDGRSDIYSLACVVYEMLTGHPPVDGATFPGGGKPVTRSLQAAGVARPIAEAIRRALALSPAERHPTAGDFERDLVRERPSRPRRGWAIAAAVSLALLLTAAVVRFRLAPPAAPARLEYTKLTNFATSATSPTLSPDGRMLAFILGESAFFGPGQVYVKLLPDGEPVALTNDSLYKMSPKFSADGTQITYTTLDGSQWDTWIVPVIGGQPRRLLTNAAALTSDAGADEPLLFSEMTGRGQQMAVVASTSGHERRRTVYMPPETGMAHRSYVSPDRKHVLVVEMNFGTWLPCRVAPFDASSPGRTVGPVPAQCTDAAWSRDGRWLYLAANTGGGSHIWRQRFPDGTPEQVTFGATEEDGIELARDGRSFVTSIGTTQSTLWVRDSRGTRQITSEGYALLPSLSADGTKLYYLLRAGGARDFVSGELWVTDLLSGRRQRALPDVLLRHYSVSADGQRVVFSAADSSGGSPLWVASLDGRTRPRRLVATNTWTAFFGSADDVIFLGEEQGGNYVYRVRLAGGDPERVVGVPVPFLESVSPDGRWAVGWGATDETLDVLLAHPLGGGPPRRICAMCGRVGSFERGPRAPAASWSPNGEYFYLSFEDSTYAVPLQRGEMLPSLPERGVRSRAEVLALRDVRPIGRGAFAGPDPSVYAFTEFAVQRNIYRVSLP